MKSVFSMTDLSCKRVLVTGGVDALGGAITLAMAERGADVAFTCDRVSDCAAEIVARVESLGRRAHPMQVGRNEPAEVTRLVAGAVKWLGGLDILIHHASGDLPSPLGDATLEDADIYLRTGIRDAVLTAQAALTHMAVGGRIVTIEAAADEMADDARQSALRAMVEAAHGGFTRGLAREAASRNITVNLIRPGRIELDPATGRGGGPSSARRERSVDDLAAVVAFVAGSQSSLMSGSIITSFGQALE